MVRHNKSKFNIAMAVFAATMLLACSKVQFSGAGDATANTNTVTPPCCTPPPPPPPPPACSISTTVPLNVTYAGLSNASASVNLFNTGDGHYYGNVSLNYTAGGSQYSATYSAPSGNNPSIPSLFDNGTETTAFNSFYNNGQNFSGFFQNNIGALVVSVTSVDSGGCASGNVYFMNFVNTGAVQSPFRECWFIYNGPYNCRADSIIGKSSTVPGGNYTQIGTFSGLPTNQAFR